ELVTLIAAQKVASPALIIVGEVVALQSKLQWFSAQANTSSYDQPLVQLEETPAQPLSSAT
ncbi:MAG: uroporphyrin-III C-methyltransferase/precorrin-2 dehydrogenase/sirohydrochlorin ferrochelatase, partial [Alteromonadaceae bacterium]